MQETRFGAPWGTQLKAISWGATLFLVALAIFAYTSMQVLAVPFIAELTVLLTLATPIICAFFTVRGYRVVGDRLFISNLTLKVHH